jgi:hypothetical protein
MKKPTLVLVPPPPKGAPGEPRLVPYHGKVEPLVPGQGLVIVERKAPYLVVICSPKPAERLSRPTEEQP